MSNFNAGRSSGIGGKLAAILKAPLNWSWKARIGAIVVLLAGLAGAAYATGNLPKNVKLPFGTQASEVAADKSDKARVGKDGKKARRAKRSKRSRARARAKARNGKRNKSARKKRLAEARRRKARRHRRARD